MDCWSLPGPVRYVQGVLEALRDGQNLIVPAPAHGAPPVDRRLRETLLHKGWGVLGPVGADGSDQAETLFAQLSLAAPSHAGLRRTAATLSECLPKSQVVVVCGVGPKDWPAWQRFLVQYEALSRNAEPFDRTLLVVLTSGVPLASQQVSAAALRVKPWHDVVGEIDTLLYASNGLRERESGGARNPRVRNLLARVIARLALWDFELADSLCERTPEELLRPRALLCELAAAVPGLQASWISGGQQRFDGQDLLHAYVLAAQGDPRGELNMRVWAAQAAEIMPVIELHRRELSRRIKPHVRLPFKLDEDEVRDLDDLEIGQLYAVACKFRLGTQICQATAKWRRLRNKLAHMETLEAFEAFDPDLLR